jgi:hypothetical protein
VWHSTHNVCFIHSRIKGWLPLPSAVQILWMLMNKLSYEHKHEIVVQLGRSRYAEDLRAVRSHIGIAHKNSLPVRPVKIICIADLNNNLQVIGLLFLGMEMSVCA